MRTLYRRNACNCITSLVGSVLPIRRNRKIGYSISQHPPGLWRRWSICRRSLISNIWRISKMLIVCIRIVTKAQRSNPTSGKSTQSPSRKTKMKVRKRTLINQVKTSASKYKSWKNKSAWSVAKYPNPNLSSSLLPSMA